MPKIGTCVGCGFLKEVHKERGSGLLWCKNCKGNDSYRLKKGWKECSLCKRTRRLAKSEPALCNKCYAKLVPETQCDKCKKIKRNVTLYRKYGSKVCTTCRSMIRNSDSTTWEWCVFCTDDRGKQPVAARDMDGLAICYVHYRKFKQKG